MADEEKKIIIDDDWKKEAQNEKENLAKEQEEKKEQKSKPMPPGDFSALVSMLTTQALFAMGLLNIEGQDKREPDLNIAKYNIDMLEALQEKTKGNLSEQEEKVLENTISQSRAAFVQVSG